MANLLVANIPRIFRPAHLQPVDRKYNKIVRLSMARRARINLLRPGVASLSSGSDVPLFTALYLQVGSSQL